MKIAFVNGIEGSRDMRRIMLASGLGWGLDAFDFYLYVYGLPSILLALHMSKAAGGLLATYTLAASALGGIVMGTLADRIGRRNALMISIAWYAIFTFFCGFAANYTQLAILRTLEGFGFGGEWAVGAVLAAEWSQDARRGRNLGIVQGSWAIGWFAANLAAQIVLSIAAPNAGWRYLFFLGILPALALLYIRRNVTDAPHAQARRSFSLPKIFRRDLLKTTVLVSLLAIGAQTGYYALFTWMPTYLATQRHLAPVLGGVYLYPVIAGALAGYLSAGYFNDRFGRRITFALFAICSAAFVPFYLWLVAANWQLVIAGPFLGFFASGIFSGFGPYLSELYPHAVRATGQGFTYNVGRGIAGVAPFAVGVLAARIPIGTAMTAVAIAAYGLVVITVAFLPETKGASLS